MNDLERKIAEIAKLNLVLLETKEDILNFIVAMETLLSSFENLQKSCQRFSDGRHISDAYTNMAKFTNLAIARIKKNSLKLETIDETDINDKKELINTCKKQLQDLQDKISSLQTMKNTEKNIALVKLNMLKKKEDLQKMADTAELEINSAYRRQKSHYFSIMVQFLEYQQIFFGQNAGELDTFRKNWQEIKNKILIPSG